MTRRNRLIVEAALFCLAIIMGKEAMVMYLMGRFWDHYDLIRKEVFGEI